MKVIKWIGIGIAGLIGLIALAAGGVYGYIKSAPSPETVCEHMAELSTDPATAKLPAALQACSASLGEPEYGLLKYASTMRCMNGADTREEIETCSSSN